MIVRMSTPESLPGVRIHTNRRGRSPPRNEDGDIVCQHSDCDGKKVTFRRPCEYNKHMDRHERPYKCTNAACEQNPGFTYSGGLLRHQREVHKMHLSKDPLYCPHSNCVRSTGAGFTRRENLEEHLRRRHSSSLESRVAKHASPPQHHQIEALPPNRKRPRQMLNEEYGITANAKEDLQDHEHAIKRLKMEVARRDTVILQQAQELERLRNLLSSLPQPLIYQALPAVGRGG